jgi:hypothetical protein
MCGEYMTIGYLTTVLVQAVGTPRRDKSRTGAVQVVMRSPKMTWVTKPVIIRNYPITAVSPTVRQAEMRQLFASVAHEAKGTRGKVPLPESGRKLSAGTLVPVPCAIIQIGLKGVAKTLLKGPVSPTFKEGRYRTYEAYRIHEEEELVKLAGGIRHSVSEIAAVAGERVTKIKEIVSATKVA